MQERAGTATNFLTNWRKDIPMTEYKVITLPFAEEDTADQTDYIAFELKSPETAVNMVRGFRKVINSLSLFPQSHELDYLAALYVRIFLISSRSKRPLISGSFIIAAIVLVLLSQ